MIRISEVSPGDLNALRKLFLLERKSTFTWMDTASFQLPDFDTETEGEYILVAHSNNIITGFISIWLPDNFIHHLYIASAFQKKGIGTELLKAASEKLKQPLQLKCLQKNKNAIAFYKKKRFIEKETGGTGNEAYILFELNENLQ